MDIKRFDYLFPVLAIDIHVGDRVKIQGFRFRVEQRVLERDYVILHSSSGREFKEFIFQPIQYYARESPFEAGYMKEETNQTCIRSHSQPSVSYCPEVHSFIWPDTPTDPRL